MRVEPLPLAQQLFPPSACASKACHMLALPLLSCWCAVNRALDFCLAVMYLFHGLHVARTAELQGPLADNDRGINVTADKDRGINVRF